MLAGCGGEPEPAPQAAPPRPQPAVPLLKADAGVPVVLAPDPNFDKAKAVAMSKEFGRRSDPFSLLAVERMFEQNQSNERVATEYGGWFSREFEENDPGARDAAIVVEPQPYRRLSGILLGNGVSALIEMEDGRVWEVVPGSQIPGTDWVVISIDSERAILRRSGNKLPKQIIVRLGPRIDQFTGGGGNDSGGGGDTGSNGREGGPGGRGVGSR